MRTAKNHKILQKSIALASVASFLMMPMSAFAVNNITAGNSPVGNLTNITNGQGSVTSITGGFIHNGTGFTHFNDFTVGSGGLANLNFASEASKYINMVNNQINIQGTFNALSAAGLGNVVFISPEGMVVGAGGVMSVGSLQTIVPTAADYNSLISKFGTLSAEDMTNVNDALSALQAGGTGVISVAGKIMASGEVDMQAGAGIKFIGDGLIKASTVGNTIGDVSLFTNTGDIVGSAAINIDAAGNIVLVAKEGGILSGKVANAGSVGEPYTINALNVKVGDGNKLSVEAANTLGDANSYKGYVAVSNKTTNLNVGSVKGANVKIENEGAGTLRTTEAISGVDSIYLNAAKGDLDVTKNVTAKNVVRLAADNAISAAGNLEVTDKGYISVFAKNGNIDMADAKIKMGNIDIKSKGEALVVDPENGSVSHGNLTISERGDAEGYLKLTDNETLSVGVKAPDSYRFDGISVTSVNGNVTQKAGTKITSAGRVDLTAGGSVNSVVQAADIIATNAVGDAVLETIGEARLGNTVGNAVKVNGAGNILVDGAVNGNTVEITSKGDVKVRPNTLLAVEGDVEHYTYGKINGANSVSITADGNIVSIDETGMPVVNSSAGDVKLSAKGDIFSVAPNGSSTASLMVDAAGKVDAEAKNIRLGLANTNGNVGKVAATEYASVWSAGNVNIKDSISGAVVEVTANGNITQDAANANTALVSDGNVTIYAKENIGTADKYVSVKAGKLNAEARNGNAFIESAENIVFEGIKAGKNVVLNGNKGIYGATTNSVIEAGKNMLLIANNNDLGTIDNAINVKVGGEFDGIANGNAYINAVENLLISNVSAGNDVVIKANGNIHQTTNRILPAVDAGGNMTLLSNNKNVGAADNYLTVNVGGKLNAQAPNGGVFIAADENIVVDKISAGKDVAVNAGKNIYQAGDGSTPSIVSGQNMLLISNNNDIGAIDNALNVKAGGEFDAIAQSGNVYLKTDDNLLINNVSAGKDVVIKANGNIHQTTNRILPAVEAGGNMTLLSNNKNVGAADNYLTVNVGGKLDAQAPNGGVFIAADENIIVDKILAGKDVAINAGKNIYQAGDGSTPSIISGQNMLLISNNNDIGAIDNAINVKVGAELDAIAQSGNVYLKTDDTLLINNISAGKDVAIKANGNIHQTTNRILPAIEAGGNMDLFANGINVGDPNNYLTVSVGDKLTAAAPNGGVYIYGYGDLTTDKVTAGKDIYLGSDKNIIIPHDKKDGNIIAGGNVKIEAGDNVLNAGGSNVGIVAGGDIDVTANLNLKDGQIGKLPYNDLNHSINVTLGGDVIKDEIGVPQADKVLNIHIMSQDTTVVPDVLPESNTDGEYSIDDRDQRNMKIVSGDQDSASARGNRQDLRYNVSNGEYVLLNSDSESGAKVVDILNISKQGMLVETEQVAKVGDTIKMSLDYKGLPFTVEGEVVRVDAANSTAGIRFNNIDQLTSSMILYLGMMNGISK